MDILLSSFAIRRSLRTVIAPLLSSSNTSNALCISRRGRLAFSAMMGEFVELDALALVASYSPLWR